MFFNLAAKNLRKSLLDPFDAVRTLDPYYTEILQALYDIENDVSQKAVTRNEAKGVVG